MVKKALNKKKTDRKVSDITVRELKKLIKDAFTLNLKTVGKTPSEKPIDVEKQINFEKQIAGKKTFLPILCGENGVKEAQSTQQFFTGGSLTSLMLTRKKRATISLVISA